MTKPISRKMAVDCLLFRAAAKMSMDSGAKAIVTFACSICHLPLEPEQNIQFDHIHADVFDGPHEYQNLRPIHAECHKKKTARDIKDNYKIKRILSPRKSKRPMPKSGRKIPARQFQTKR